MFTTSTPSGRRPLAALVSASVVVLMTLPACDQKGAPEGTPAPGKPSAPASTAAPASGSTAPASTAASAAAPAAGDIPAPADVAAPPADAEKTASGLASKVLSPGKGGDHPKEWDEVKVHYTGWTTDGKMFDSSVKRGEPASFPLNRVIKGWTEGVQLLTVGEKRRFWIPVEMAYNNRPGRPAGMLVFDVELLEITKGKEPPAPPVTPPDVAAVPKDAVKDKSGLSSKVLTPGTGKDHPKATSRVKVHYSGWTTDGKMFDSSVMRGEPITFGLDQVIPGWTAGVQLMVIGEKRRLWIPQEMAYKGQPGAPAGMLVFDVELIGIE